MKFINFAVVKFAACVVAGILSAYYLLQPFLFLKILLPLFLLLFALYLVARKQLFQNIFFGIATYICFFSIGYFSYQIRLPKFKKEHYFNIISLNEAEMVQIKIIQSLKPDSFNVKYFGSVNAINGIRAQGKIILNISKDSINKIFLPDEILLVYGSISEISKPLNLYQFDYSTYMNSLGVYGQIRVSEKEILKIAKGKPTLRGKAENIRYQIVKKLQKTKLKADERAIIQALILGEKKDIDKQIYSEYASAGAVHILAVSGLHVGILYLILSFLFRVMKRIKYGVYIHAILIVLVLWAFAIISGLSPSVTRAVTMFSFFALASLFNRQTNSINTLFLSFFTLLIINPLWLFQVGFQLSYLAVFFIVWLQPMFYKMLRPKQYIFRKIWGIVSVTFCAQIGVLPLSLYYFHQFPGLFLLTNLVVLPFLTVLMVGGLIIVALSTLNILPDWLAITYNYTIEGLNSFIHWVAMQDQFLFRDITFSVLKVLGCYALLIGLILFWKKRSLKRLATSLLGISFFIGIYIWDSFKTSGNQLVVFQKNKHTLLGYKHGRNFILFRNDSTVNFKEAYPLKAYRVSMNIENYSEKTLPNIFSYEGKIILTIDSLGIYPKTQNIDIIILTDSPKINLSRIADGLKPKLVIADGSNYYSYVERWRKTCSQKKLPFRHTAKTGAFFIE